MTDPVMPAPPDALEAERWNVTARRHRMLTGAWRVDADERLGEFFDPTVADYLPEAEVSRNAFYSVTVQLSTLYDEEPYAAPAPVKGMAIPERQAEDVARVVNEELWALAQQNLVNVVGLNESLMRVDIDADGLITYRVVTPDFVCARATASRPDVPVAIEECRLRESPTDATACIWTWEVWDVSDPARPVFRICERLADGTENDLTAHYAEAEGWPDRYRNRAGQPVLPYILYHRVVGRTLWAPMRGHELVCGTLTSAALWTMWVGGVRDGAHPQRAVIDGDILGGKVTRPGAGANPTEAVVMNPMTVVQIKSRGDTSRASIGQWQPAMEPKSSAEAIEGYDSGLAIYGGVSPGDLQRGSSVASGYSIVVSRDGQRKAQRRLRVPMGMGDRLLLATASQLANAAHGSDLPETPEGWVVRYPEISKSPDEVKAELEEIAALRAAGLLSRRRAWLRLNPGSDEADADAALAEIDAEDDDSETEPSTGKPASDDTPEAA